MNSELDSSRFTNISLRTAAIVAGLGLLIMTILAIIANFGVLQGLIIPGDATTTAANITASEELFRIGVFSLLIVSILDVVVAWALYVFLIPVHKSLSLLAAWFRVVYAAIFAIALNNLLFVLNLLSGADYFKVFETNQFYAQVMLSLNAFTTGWDIGLAFFGLHLLIVGYLAFKSGYIPKLLGILIIIAGLGYLIDSLGKLLIPTYNISITMFTFIGEALLFIWLLWKSFKGFDIELETKN